MNAGVPVKAGMSKKPCNGCNAQRLHRVGNSCSPDSDEGAVKKPFALPIHCATFNGHANDVDCGRSLGL